MNDYAKSRMTLTDQDRVQIAKLRSRIPTNDDGRTVWRSADGRRLLERLTSLRQSGVSTKLLADAADMTRNNFYAVMAYPRNELVQEQTPGNRSAQSVGEGNSQTADTVQNFRVTLDSIASKTRIFAENHPDLIVELRVTCK